MTWFTHQAQGVVLKVIRSISQTLQLETPYVLSKQDGYTVHSFTASSLTVDRVRQFKPELLTSLGLHQKAKTVQLIGDCPGTFDCHAQEWVRKKLEERIAELEEEQKGQIMYLYGLTGKGENRDGVDAACTNTTFAQIIEAMETEHKISSRVVGNVVNGGTTTVIEKFGCIVSGLVHTLLNVWSPDGANFGDDTILSDNLMGEEDLVICLEGGAQSLAQVLTSISNKCNVELFDNLRGSKNPDCRISDHEFGFFLSASSFVKHIQSTPIASKQEALQAIIDYVKLPKPAVENLAKCADISITDLRYPTDASRLYANEKNYDISTKLPQILDAFKLFLNQELWTSIKGEKVRIVGTFEPSSPSQGYGSLFSAADDVPATDGVLAAAAAAAGSH